MEFSNTCKQCGKQFTTHKSQKKFCKKECYYASKHHQDVSLVCTICSSSFVVLYKFRGTKTCSPTCTKLSISRALTTRETKQCLACGKDYDVVQSYKDAAKYCSYDCFLSKCNTRQPDVVLVCAYCKQNFTVSFTRSNQRFCDKSCANSGENNAMYGKPGIRTGLPAWSRGLTAKTDHRLGVMGMKISKKVKQAFVDGKRSHVGDGNPNFGHTVDKLTHQQRVNYSRAAVQRVLSGVSGYKTGHVTGIYHGLKSPPVKFKSSWELAVMMWWENMADVISYHYEPKIIELDDGRRAIPDFIVLYSDGKSVYVEIKPTAIQNLPVVAQRLFLVKTKIEEQGSSYVLIGNHEIDEIKRTLGKELNDAIERYKDRC